MASEEQILEQKKELYFKIAAKQSGFPESSPEHRLFNHMVNMLWDNWDDRAPTERELYVLAVNDLEYQPPNSVVASQVLPDSVKKEIFDKCENEGYGFASGMLVNPEMMTIVGYHGSDHRGLVPGAVSKTLKQKDDSPYAQIFARFSTGIPPLEVLASTKEAPTDSKSNPYNLSDISYLPRF